MGHITMPTDLAEVVALHREVFGGYRMEAEAGEQASPEETPPAAGDDQPDEQLGEAGKKALDAERAQNKDLRQQLAAVKAFQDGLAKLVNPDGDPKVTPEDAIKQLGEKVEALTHSNLVKDIAREFGITEKDDIDLLAELKTEDRIRGLAERLKPADTGGDDDGKKGKRGYRPDPSAGKGGGDNAGKPASVAEVMAARRDARAAKSKTN